MTDEKNMSRELIDVVEHFTATIVMTAREEEFYRRSAEATSRQDIKKLMLEVTEDLARLGKKMEARRENLLQTFRELQD